MLLLSDSFNTFFLELLDFIVETLVLCRKFLVLVGGAEGKRGGFGDLLNEGGKAVIRIVEEKDLLVGGSFGGERRDELVEGFHHFGLED